VSGAPAITAATASGEIPAVRRLFEEYARELGIDLAFQGFADELDQLPGVYAPPDGRLVLAKEEGEIVGVAALRRLDPDVCELKRMVVRKDQRGRGIGRRLADAIVAEARELGYRAMRLDTLARLRPATRLYRSMGFVEIPPYRPNPHDDVVYLELDLRERC